MPSETKLRVYGRLAPQANSNGAQTHGVSSTLGAVYRGLNLRSFHVSYGSGYIMYGVRLSHRYEALGLG